MRANRSATAVLVLPALAVGVLLVPRPARTWGFDGHRFIVERAIELLPEPLRPFYRKHRPYVVEHSVDPDLWRLAGFEDESARHFIDLDAYGVYPFSELPRDYDAAVKKFGRRTVHQRGILPWRVAELSDRLATAFERQKKGGSAFLPIEIWFLSAAVSHYVSDAYQPFHTVRNHDGQLTGQHGIHARFETGLFERYGENLSIRPEPRPPVVQPRDFIFEVVLAGTRFVDGILEADRDAAAGRDLYDEIYYERFLKGTRAILEQRLGEAASAIAAIVAGAWERGGRPEFPPDPPRTIERARRPVP